MKNLIIALIVMSILGVMTFFVVKEHNRIQELPSVYYTGTVVNENSLLDNLLNEYTEYTFTSNEGLIILLSFNNSLDEDKTYILEYTAIPLIEVTFMSHTINTIKINNDWYELRNIVIVPDQVI